MDNFVVNRGAEGGGIAVVALERSDGTQFGNFLDGDLFEIHSGGAGQDIRRDRIVHQAKGLAGDSHLLDLLRRFDHDGHKASFVSWCYRLDKWRRRLSADSMEAVTCSTG